MASRGYTSAAKGGPKAHHYRYSPTHNDSGQKSEVKAERKPFPVAAHILRSPAHSTTRCVLCSAAAVVLVVLHVLVLLVVFQQRLVSCRQVAAFASISGQGTLQPNLKAAGASALSLPTTSGSSTGGSNAAEAVAGKSGAVAGRVTASAGVGKEGERAPRFLLYRVIGNNMPPLQCPSQLLWNTLYALRHEGPLHDCGKRWVLNHIVNHTERALLIDALLSNGYSMSDILVRRLNLTQVSAYPRSQWLDAVTAQNEARNAAVEDGIAAGARWILPFDGNHFITAEAWRAIERLADEAEEKGYKYFKVPVHRLHAEQHPSWLSSDSSFSSLLPKIPLRIESQLAFRADAPLRFKPGMVYGVQNKLELLDRACNASGGAVACGCQELGVEGQAQKSDASIATKCGYSLRLWFYPCEGTEARKVFGNGMYRKRMRSRSRQAMGALIRNLVQHPTWFEKI